MNYIVIDLEWNQKFNRTKTRALGEIIEIGAVKLGEDQRIEAELRLLVKPSVYGWMHPHVRKIVNVSESQLKDGVLFEEAFRQLSAFCGEDYAFLSWGDEDAFILMQNLAYYGLDVNFAARHYDLQKIYHQQFEDGGMPQRGLAFCVDKLGVEPQDGAYHSALTDARYAAKIFQLIDLDRAKAENSGVFRPTARQERAYFTNFRALTDPREGLPVCPVCGRKVSRISDLFMFSGDNLIAVARCDADGYFTRIYSLRPRPKAAREKR